jgi:hypothetical protein
MFGLHLLGKPADVAHSDAELIVMGAIPSILLPNFLVAKRFALRENIDDDTGRIRYGRRCTSRRDA